MKEMVNEMFNDFKGIYSSTPLGRLAMPTVIPLEAIATVRGRILRNKLLFSKNLPLTLKGSHNQWPLRKKSLRLLKLLKNLNPEVQPEGSSFPTPKVDRGKGVARDTNDSPRKLVKVSREVHLDLDAPILNDYEINGVMYQLTNEEIQAYLEKQEQMAKAAHEAKMIELSKPELIKVIEHLDKLNKSRELKKKIIDQYVLTTQNRLKPEKNTNILIHPNTRQVTITVYRNNDQRNFDVHKNFKFSDFGVSEWDELGVIIPKKKNKVVGELMQYLSKKYEMLKEIPGELGINATLPLPEQYPSLSLM
ncbi:hypothetical protein Tco_0719994 [Tanacetum coccineum]